MEVVVSFQITERSCGHYNEREEPTVMIPLVVRGKKGIQESLEAIVEPEDVRLECEICKTKKKVTKLPSHLLLL